jgi:hypothetical protein
VFDALVAEAFTGGTPITAADDEHARHAGGSTQGGMNQGFVIVPLLPFRRHPAAVEQEPTAVALTSDHRDSLKRAGFLHQHLADEAIADAPMVFINPATHAVLCCVPSAWDPKGCAQGATDSVQGVDDDQI